MNKARTGETVCSLPKARPVAKWAALMAVAALICALIPLYAAAQYSYAGVDDYRYGATTHAVWAETGSLGATLAEAARVAGKTYVEWQGSLSAIFLMALQPGIFSDGAYGLSTVLLLSALVASLLVFCWTLCRVGLQMGQHEALALGALLTAYVLIRGIMTMASGKDITGEQSNKLMSLRVLFQAITIMLVLLLLVLGGRGLSN